jgi:hypothetical protein
MAALGREREAEDRGVSGRARIPPLAKAFGPISVTRGRQENFLPPKPHPENFPFPFLAELGIPAVRLSEKCLRWRPLCSASVA